MNESKKEIMVEDTAPKSINEGKTEFEKMSIPIVLELTLPDVFKDGMLFDADKPVIIWGLSPYKKPITVTLFDKNGEAVRRITTFPADDNSFETEFEGVESSFDDYILEIKTGRDVKQVKDILFGRLYLVGGQSNMDMLVRNIYRKEEILTAEPNSFIRIYNPAVVPCKSESGALAPVFSPEIGGPWVRADALESLKDITAVGLVFAKGIFKRLNSEAEQVPVGILSTSHGGTIIETWMSRQSIEQDIELKNEMLKNRVLANEGDTVVAEELNRKGMNNTTVLYNMKIAPLANLNISGLVWYQGESQVGKSMSLFTKELDSFIKEYSKIFRWGDHNLPTFLINITPYPYEGIAEKSELGTGGAEVNETFNDFAKRHMENVVSMPTYDISLRYEETETWDPNPIHPTDKIPLAERAVELFWGLTHDNFVSHCSSVTVENEKVTAEFANTYDGLVTKNNEPVKGFKLCGVNKKFFPADAVIADKNKVVLSSADVPQPVGIRYAFCSMNNEANLFNSRGIPVQLFRTEIK